MKQIKVIFRKDKKSGDIIAFLPETSANRGRVMSYMHFGQHSEADYMYYLSDTVAASETEYGRLLNELQGIYDNALIVRQRIHYADLQKSWGGSFR